MRVVRVTECLDYFMPPQLVAWKIREGNGKANQIMRSTEKTGSRIDKLIKDGLEPDKKDSPEVHACHKAFRKWQGVYGTEPVQPCKRIQKAVNGIILSGEPDWKVFGILMDCKGTNTIRKKNWLQLAAYTFLEDWTEPSAILRLDRETASYEYVVKPYEDIKPLISVFMGLLSAYVYYTEDDYGGRSVQEVGEVQEVA